MGSNWRALRSRTTGGVLSTLIILRLMAGATAVAQGAPGALDVDEDAAERALERTLVERGVLLLPRGAYELEPVLRYEYSERDEFVLGSVGGDLVLDRQIVERNELTSSLNF